MKFKKLLVVVLSVMIMCTVLPSGNFFVSSKTIQFAGGDGTESNPYLIETKEHLNNVRYNLDAHYKLIADIVFTDVDFAESGDFFNDSAGWLSIGNSEKNPFSGVFDGNNFSITGIEVSPAHLYNSVGLFGYTTGTIKNLNLYGVNIVLSVHAEYDFSRVGGITGTLIGGTIDDCTVSGLIDSAVTFEGDAYAGGVVGYALNANITNCNNECTVKATDIYNRTISYAGGIAGVTTYGMISSCKNTGEIIASGFNDNNYAGGICGNSNFTTITFSFNTANIHAETSDTSPKCAAFAGGIAGATFGEYVSDCFNAGSITTDTTPEALLSGNDWNGNYSGGIVGKSDDCTTQRCYNIGSIVATKRYGTAKAGGIVGYTTGPVTDCYYLDTIEKGVGVGSDTAIKHSNEKLQNVSNFDNWDFQNIWEFKTNNSYKYPTLISNPYFLSNADLNCDGNINANDIAILRKELLSNSVDNLKYDLNYDNNVDLRDLVRLKKKVVGIIA